MARITNSNSRLLKDMVAKARALKAELLQRGHDTALAAARDSLAAELGRDVSADEVADVLAQATVCAGPMLRGLESQVALEWLRGTLSEWERWVVKLVRDSVRSTKYQVLSTKVFGPHTCGDHESTHPYDQFLHRYAPPTRKHHGVFFTPQPIANYIVRQIDAILRGDFGLPDGLAFPSAIRTPHSALHFIDPACGTGVFLLAVIDHLHARLGNDWNDFAAGLLPRLTGIELLPVPALLAKLNIVLKLAETGYDFRQPGSIRVHTGDALSPNSQFAICNLRSAIPIVLGNPPFSSLSTNTNPWIARLVRGDGLVRGYVQAGDERLGERKTWLHDDYVKFIRLAQWIVEQAGAGIVGYVTNHGYLDNATFRLLRQELLRVFPHVQIVDLHGNRKKGETAPGGGQDENVFGLDQGVAIGLFAKPTRSVSEGAVRSEPARVDYAELWGTREEKLASLDAAPSPALQACSLSPQPPQWRLIPTSDVSHPEYAAGWPLSQAMPVNTTAPVTARDQFVVAFTREELERRIAEFRDLSIPDEVIRARYFHRTRSRRYERGDTRSWKLAAARHTVAADSNWQDNIIRCLYRPFDWRFVFWHPAMIDWPRNEITRHLIPPSSQVVTGQRDGETESRREEHRESSLRPSVSPSLRLVLITRRQQLPTQPCTYFWISDCLALDGVIRSDNRGSESLFPLWLIGADGSRSANFAREFIEQVATQIGKQPAAEDMLAYVYALFHSATYRERYAHLLRSDFPRVLLPGSGQLFDALTILGQRLIELHFLRGEDGVGSLWRKVTSENGQISPAKDSRPPGTGLSEDFRVGGYTVLKKWLQRKHRSPHDAEYSGIVAAIDETIEIMATIDASIAEHGGFPAAFPSKPRPVVGVLGESPSIQGTP